MTQQASPPVSPAPTQTQPQATQATAPAPERVSQPAPRGGGNWADVIQRATIQMRAFLKPARMHAEAGYVSLSYDVKGKFHAKQVYEKFDDIGALVAQVFGAVTFELISPEHNRKQVVGGAQAIASAQAAVPTQPSQAAASQATPQPAPTLPSELPDFEPTRRAPAATHTSPPPLDDLPPFEPTRRTTPASNPATAGKVMPPSPDDIAAAPLPEASRHTQQHSADIPPEPTESGPPPIEDSPPPEMYVPAETLSQEPDWDDLPPLDFKHAEAVNAAPVSAAPPPQAQTARRPAPVATGPIQGMGAAIRNHPNYQEVTRLFSGRIKEVGEVKKVAAAVEQEVQEDDAAGGEALEA